jgi:hypothetical protein
MMHVGVRAKSLLGTVCLLLVAGCGPAANEENVTAGSGAATPKEGQPKFQSYAEYQLHETEQARKKVVLTKSRANPATRRQSR